MVYLDNNTVVMHAEGLISNFVSHRNLHIFSMPEAVIKEKGTWRIRAFFLNEELVCIVPIFKFAPLIPFYLISDEAILTHISYLRRPFCVIHLEQPALQKAPITFLFRFIKSSDQLIIN